MYCSDFSPFWRFFFPFSSATYKYSKIQCADIYIKALFKYMYMLCTFRNIPFLCLAFMYHSRIKVGIFVCSAIVEFSSNSWLSSWFLSYLRCALFTSHVGDRVRHQPHKKESILPKEGWFGRYHSVWQESSATLVWMWQDTDFKLLLFLRWKIFIFLK